MAGPGGPKGPGKRLANAKREKIVALILRGQTSDCAIAERTGVSRATISHIRRDPEVQAEIKAIRESAVAEARESLKQFLHELNYEIVKIVKSKATKPETKLDAIKHLHQIHGLLPEASTVAPSVPDDDENIDNLSSAQLAEKYKASVQK